MPETLPPLIDSHCHLTWPSFDGDRPAVIQRMHEAGVAQAVVIATTIDDAHAVRDLCAGEASLFPTAGIHPNDLPEDLDAGCGKELQAEAQHETGS